MPEDGNPPIPPFTKGGIDITIVAQVCVPIPTVSEGKAGITVFAEEGVPIIINAQGG